ncbi:hypothetical protein [Nocardia altamirensis]|uniref:hypothetical protein n=1 Tax=Nocardia altamirensis TaxID=472158 RepID=UPI001FE22F71|nr:hypothetical protein [Nocardia altamirensis]
MIISTSITRSKHATRMYMEPSFASSIGAHLGAKKAITFDISSAGAGMLTGVYVLDRLIQSGAARNGMVVSRGETTPIAENTVREITEKYEVQFAARLVGDSGCAIVLEGGVIPFLPPI